MRPNEPAQTGICGKPRVAIETFGGGELPVLREGLDELRNDRPLNAKMQILHRHFRTGGHDVLVGNVHAAGETRKPSTTRIFLWERRLRNGIRQGNSECMKRAAITPSRRKR